MQTESLKQFLVMLKNISKFKGYITAIGAIVFICIFAYWGAWNGFFQQDEWAGLGGFYAKSQLTLGERLIAVYRPMFSQGLSHFLLLVPIVNLVRYSLIGINYPYVAILAIIAHIAVSISVFVLILKFTKNLFASFLAAVFFSANVVGSQAVIWVGTSIPTQMAALFSVLSIIFWNQWTQTNNRKFIYKAIFFLILALSFKETSFFLLIFMPLSLFISSHDLRYKLLRIFFLFGLSYLFLRAIVAGFSSGIVGILLLATANYAKVIASGVAQTLLTDQIILKISRQVTNFLGIKQEIGSDTYQYELLVLEKVVPPLVLLITTLFFIVFFTYLLKKNTEQRRKFLNAMLFFVTSFIPLTFISTSELSNVLLPSRNLYLPLVGLALLIGTLISDVRRRKVLILAICAMLLLNLRFIRISVNEYIAMGQQRQRILNTIKANYPDLPDKVIIYAESDSSYYGLGENEKTLPFQSGFGQTLLVWYFKEEQFPSTFFENDFLWEIRSQGYKEEGTRGYGFFREKAALEKAFVENKLSVESVIAFSWKREDYKLIDITWQVRDSLKDL